MKEQFSVDKPYEFVNHYYFTETIKPACRYRTLYTILARLPLLFCCRSIYTVLVHTFIGNKTVANFWEAFTFRNFRSTVCFRERYCTVLLLRTSEKSETIYITSISNIKIDVNATLNWTTYFITKFFPVKYGMWSSYFSLFHRILFGKIISV